MQLNACWLKDGHLTENRSTRIREAQCQLLVSSSKKEEIISATERHIRDLAGGRMSHRYAALSLGYRMAIEAKRGNPHARNTETPFPAGPTLQCSNQDCSEGNKPLLNQESGGLTSCRICGSGLKCHVCGSPRFWLAVCSGCGEKWN